ncbi:hypothetical protein DL766_006518 [Monosporascus sp. MC13-8B]|uniref:Uncharacterized protein n=1 Tax=Monosporascus cannonballus TaxID=155416 RepID=A0ABY0HNW5_9PEZI|nr:hypothetical protein DL762_000015 [Monosporascus cannonballus]RYP27096.1 hypothetical protein DL766_006518 [Monosporascus sp. MC13-8B]
MIREQEEGFRVWLYADQQGCAAATLNFLVVSARVMGASDPRDRVFAFLGIWEKVAKELFGQKLSIKADYAKTVQATYTEFMTIVLEETGSLNFLSSVRPGYGTNRIEVLPSWVPDYLTASAVPVIQYLSGLVPLKDIDAYANIRSCNPPRSDNAKTGEDDPFIPTLVELKAICERLGFWENGDGDPSGTEMQEMNAEVSKLDLIFQYTYETRRPFLLDSGYLG